MNAESSYEKILEKCGFLCSTCVGVSMKPLFHQKKDVLIIRPLESVRPGGDYEKYDIVLFRRPRPMGHGAYVVHRILKVIETNGPEAISAFDIAGNIRTGEVDWSKLGYHCNDESKKKTPAKDCRKKTNEAPPVLESSILEQPGNALNSGTIAQPESALDSSTPDQPGNVSEPSTSEKPRPIPDFSKLKWQPEPEVEGWYWIVGDNCFCGEFVNKDDILGIVTGIKSRKKAVRLLEEDTMSSADLAKSGFSEHVPLWYKLYMSFWIKPYRFRLFLLSCKWTLRAYAHRAKKKVKHLLGRD